MNNFPFKHLIWAIVVVVALFLFRQSWMHIVYETEEITVFNKVSLKVKKGHSEALKQAETEFRNQVDSLNQMVTSLDGALDNLEIQTNTFLNDIKDCDQAKEAAGILKEHIFSAQSAHDRVRRHSGILQKATEG